MTLDQQSRIARTFRAWTGLHQNTVAAKAGLGEKTLIELEMARACSDKTWAKVIAFYESVGLSWRDGDPGIIVVRG